jgi:cytidylate kinase
MAIVTISRGTFAGGQQLARMLSDRLGYRIVSREQVFEKTRADYGVTAEQLTEATTRTPSFYDPATRRMRRMVAVVEASFCQLLGEDNVIYHGQVGQILLTGVTHALRVRLIAPRSQRVEWVKRHDKLNDYDASLKVDRIDEERSRWTHFFYEVDWTDPALYDLVVQVDRMTVRDGAEVVSSTARLDSFVATDDSKRTLANLALRSRVLARLFTCPATNDLDVDVTADSGRIRVCGLSSPRNIDEVMRVAADVPGVTAVDAAR